jgi:hypothetical protein
MSTRRRLPRQPADWPGRYHFEDVPDVLDNSCCVVDISRMGAGVEIFGDSPIDPIGRRVSIDVEGPSNGSIWIHMEGLVRNASSGPVGGVRIGIEFVGLSEVELAILDALEQMQVAW